MLSNNGVFSLPTTFITGVASYASGAILSNYIDFNNIGSNFLVHSNFGQYSLTVGVGGTVISATSNLDSTNSNITPIFDTANNQYSTGLLPNPARIRAITILTAGTTAFTSSNADVVMNIRGCNINNSIVTVNCNVLYAFIFILIVFKIAWNICSIEKVFYNFILIFLKYTISLPFTFPYFIKSNIRLTVFFVKTLISLHILSLRFKRALIIVFFRIFQDF
jgi:hypothetical protein